MIDERLGRFPRAERPAPARPLLVAVCREPGPIADDEIATLIEWGGLDPERGIETVHLLAPDAPEPEDIDLDRYWAVAITGSPFGIRPDPVHDAEHPPAGGMAALERMRRRAVALAGRLVAEDRPALALCFGLQAIALALGGELTSDQGEDLSAPHLRPTEAGLADPVTGRLPTALRGYVGHAASLAVGLDGALPGGGTILLTGTTCQVQMARWGRHVYGTQFHPEITTEGMRIRIAQYGGAYYPPEERAAVIERCDSADVTGANALITAFTNHYAHTLTM